LHSDCFVLFCSILKKLEPDLLSAAYLDHWNPKFSAGLLPIVATRAPRAAAAGLWADEIAAAWGSCGGGAKTTKSNVVCDRFMDGYWFVHQLGTLAAQGHSVFARQTLRGGWYELLNQTDSSPHPDYYTALLWRRLMAVPALNAAIVEPAGSASGTCAGQLRAFAACTPASTPARAGGAATARVSVAVINFCQTGAIDVSFRGADDRVASGMRSDYLLTPCPDSGGIHSNCIALNGVPLHSSGGVPAALVPNRTDSATLLTLPPGSYAWSVVELPGSTAAAVCHASLKSDDRSERAVAPPPAVIEGRLRPSGLCFRWSYLPSHNLVRFVILQPPVTADGWVLQLHAPVGVGSSLPPSVLCQANGSLPLGPLAYSLPVPHLPTGVYTLRLQLKKATDVVAETAANLTRQKRPWEGNNLGKDDIVIPPFQALEISRAKDQLRLGVVGRELLLGGGLGLWQQVNVTPVATPRGPQPTPIPVLASEISLVAEVGGVDKAATATEPVSIRKATPTTVTTTSGWRITDWLEGSTAVEYDIDGCAQVTLMLAPNPSTPVNSLQLRIPLKLSEAPLMHAVTDALRFHYAGRVASGEGEVYNTSDIKRFQLPGPFVPYLWIGGPERGVAMFADNDQGWLSAEPAYQLLRDSQNETLTLVANIVSQHNSRAAQGATWNTTRAIVFGLMPSPAKPQPTRPMASPRSWWPGAGPEANGPDNEAWPTTLRLTMLGAGYYWGTQTDWLQYYPINHNYSIYSKLAQIRKTGDVGQMSKKTHPTMANDWLRDWMQIYQSACKSGVCYEMDGSNLKNISMQRDIYGSILSAMKRVASSYTRVHRNHSVAPELIIPYTNPRAVVFDDDAEQFIDEWSEYSIDDPRYSDPSAWACGSWEGCRRFHRESIAELERNASLGYWKGWSTATDPVPSYADMVMHETKKMQSTFADGIYYDNIFFHANYNTAPAGPAYINDDGVLVPGVSFWDFRNLIKRAAIMQHADRTLFGGENTGSAAFTRLWLHMTNCNLIPILSWASVNLDWEWHMLDGLEEDDCQTRNGFGCDNKGQHCNDTSLILAQTTGMQAGTVGIAIGSGYTGSDGCRSRPDLRGKDCAAWLIRTVFATAIPHEVRPSGWAWQPKIPASPDGEFVETKTSDNVTEIFDGFGYADPRCDVYRFWEADFPIATSGAVTLPLVIRCPASGGGLSARVLVFFGSFGPKGDVNFALDRQALGLSAHATAVDAENGRPVLPAGGGNFSLRLDKHSFRIVALKTDNLVISHALRLMLEGAVHLSPLSRRSFYSFSIQRKYTGRRQSDVNAHAQASACTCSRISGSAACSALSSRRRRCGLRGCGSTAAGLAMGDTVIPHCRCQSLTAIP
jgi:hypothetical protein